MPDNSAVVKIIAQHTRDYNALDRRYKQLGVKHATLLGVHKKTIDKMASQEDIHHELKEQHKVLVSRFVDMKLVCSNLKKKLKEEREEFLDDLTVIDEIDWDKTWKLYADIRKKWEGKS